MARWVEEKANVEPNFGEILVLGEKIRFELHNADGQLIRERCRHTQKYAACFLGREVVDWLVETGHAADRKSAVYLMNILMQNRIIHHVSDQYQFRDKPIWYRFRKDDGTYPWYEELGTYMRGSHLFNRLLQEGRDCFVPRLEDGTSVYTNCFRGNELVDWMLARSEACSRTDAVRELRGLVDSGVVRHVSSKHQFRDTPLIYQFITEWSQLQKLRDLYQLGQWRPSGKQGDITSSSLPKDIPSASGGKMGWMASGDNGYHSGESPRSDYSDSTTSSTLTASTESEGNEYDSDNSRHTCTEERFITAADLEDSDRFYERNLRIRGDEVGFGFVLRGDGPVFVKVVDPEGPAAKTGLKEGQYIYRVNDILTIDQSHRDLAHVILGETTTALIKLTVKEKIHKHS